MSILVNSNSRVVVQGITGREGGFHASQMLDYGTPIVAGVTPGKGGTEFRGVPVYDSVREAVAAQRADTSIIFVPPPFAADAICEAAAAGIRLVICITEGVPVHDMLRALRFIAERGTRLIGPNCPGVITPNEAKVGIMPADIYARGKVGLISRSGTLTYEMAQLLRDAGLGCSTCVGIGGDPLIGSTFVDILELFRDDPETESIVLIGEIGGSDEEAAARYLAETQYAKPVVAFISGRSAPPGKRMGHAGAIISGSSGTPQAKVEAFQRVGVPVADTLDQVIALLPK
ncbi:MAG: succinate--CoA ligase subunit alpha [Chloroflexi bacterium]|nr:succinate--CoA ligase subunit alpha [Chloroflexota bacterium]